MRTTNRSPARIQYINAEDLTLRRVPHGRGFRYVDGKGKPVGGATLKRLEAMVLRPAWRDVRLCPNATGHLQAIGIDQRGRKQYVYHREWRRQRDEKKFDRLIQFAEALPHIRRVLKAHLAARGYPRKKILAAAVTVLQKTNMRVGNDIYTRTNKSFGLTTLRNQHAQIQGPKIHFHYRAKGGKVRDIKINDVTLSRILKHCQDLPGQDLFGYRDDKGRVHDIKSTDVNRYICRIAKGNFSAKDFRTWCGTTRAIELFTAQGKADVLSERGWRQRHLQVIRQTAEYLGNTPSICEKYYIHPHIFVADRNARLLQKRRTKRVPGLNALECSTLAFLKQA